MHSEPIKSDKEVMAMCAVIAKSLEALARRFPCFVCFNQGRSLLRLMSDITALYFLRTNIN